MKKMIIYQVLTRLWSNGKFSDWSEECLNYLKSLSVDCVWFTGVPRHAAPSEGSFVKGDAGSPYAVVNWFDTNDYFSASPSDRMKDFEALVKRCHKAGLKVLIDFIPNHVACNYSGSIPVYDYCDYDWTDTRKVNYNDPMTIPVMSEMLKFWIGKGVDGFRCDMVELVPSESMKRIISNIKSEKPEVMFVAEIYQKSNYRNYLDNVGFDLLYDKSGIYDTIRSIVAGQGSARQITWNWLSIEGMQDRMLNFLENHDEQRVASKWFASEPEKAFAALAASALLNNASFMLYFGQELGEKAEDGAEGKTSIFNWTGVKSVTHLVKWIETGTGLTRREKAVLDKYRELLALASSPVFAEGSNWDLCYCQDPLDFNADNLFAFVRYNDREAWAVLCNFSGSAVELSLNLPAELCSRLKRECPAEIGVKCEASDYTAVRLY